MSRRYQPPRILTFAAAVYAAARAAARSGPVPTTLSTRPPLDTSWPVPEMAVPACKI